MLYGLLAAVWRCWRPAYEPLIGLFDATPHRPPFGDLVSILQAGACWRHGVNVFVANPCMNGGTFNYSPFMLRSLLYPFSPADGTWLGLLIAAAFISACACLPPACSAWQMAGRCLAVCSGMVMYALEAANVDAVIFVLLAGGVWLLRARSALSLAAYGVFAFAGALKFYPAVLLGLMLRESRVRLALVAGLMLAGGVLFLVHFGHDSQIAVAGLPAGLPYRGGFSAMNIPFGLALLVFSPVLTLDPTPAEYFSAIAAPHFAQYVVLGTWGLIALALLAAWRRAAGYEAALARLDEPRRLFLLAGAMLIAFCFLAAEKLRLSRHFPAFRAAGPAGDGSLSGPGRRAGAGPGFGGAGAAVGGAAASGAGRGGAVSAHPGMAAARRAVVVAGGQFRCPGLCPDARRLAAAGRAARRHQADGAGDMNPGRLLCWGAMLLAGLSAAVIDAHILRGFFPPTGFRLAADLDCFREYGLYLGLHHVAEAQHAAQVCGFKYPPPYLLLATPLAWLTPLAAFALWGLVSALSFLVLGRALKLSWPVIALGLLAPPALQCLVIGENSVLLAAPLLLALAWVESAPLAAGIAAGLLVVKPQLALMLPVCFLAGRHYRAFMAAAASAAALCLLSALLFGGNVWVWFLHSGLAAARQTLADPWPQPYQHILLSPFIFLRALGGSVGLAEAMQGAVTLAAMVAVWRLWRPAALRRPARLPLTLCLAALATPYGYIYDLPALALALASVTAQGAWRRMGALAWLWVFTGGYLFVAVFWAPPGALCLLALALALSRNDPASA